MFKKTLVLLTGALLLFTLSACSDSPSDNEIDYEADVKPLIESSAKPRVQGSCNVIAEKSTCIDFIGEIFTEDRMRLSCEEGTFSFDSCPYSDLGGCQALTGTVSESIAWSYGTGGAPITPEEAGYQAQACNALLSAK
jgi:hypothetical protein